MFLTERSALFLKALQFQEASEVLQKVYDAQGSDKVDISLKMAECELRLARGNEEYSLNRVKDSILNSPLSSKEAVDKMADELHGKEQYIRSLVLNRSLYALPTHQNLSSDENVKWIALLVSKITSNCLPLMHAGGTSRDIGIRFGLIFTKQLLRDLREIRNVNHDVKVLGEAECLVGITTMCICADEYLECIRFGREGVKILEKEFDVYASRYRFYGALQDNLTRAYDLTGEYSNAQRCCVSAIEAYQKAYDFENEIARREVLDKARKKLSEIRSELGV